MTDAKNHEQLARKQRFSITKLRYISGDRQHCSVTCNAGLPLLLLPRAMHVIICSWWTNGPGEAAIMVVRTRLYWTLTAGCWRVKYTETAVMDGGRGLQLEAGWTGVMQLMLCQAECGYIWPDICVEGSQESAAAAAAADKWRRTWSGAEECYLCRTLVLGSNC